MEEKVIMIDDTKPELSPEAILAFAKPVEKEEYKPPQPSHHQNAKRPHTKAEVIRAKKEKRQKHSAKVIKAASKPGSKRLPSPRPNRNKSQSGKNKFS